MSGTQPYETSCDRYEIITLIGRGHMNRSLISLAKYVGSDTVVAVKKIDLEKRDKELHLLQNEISLTQQLHHRNILPILSTFISQHELWVVTPLLEFGSCQDLIQVYFTSGLKEQAILFILRDVLTALDYIHQQGIIHRGIKGSHVLISKTGQSCLTGFQNAYRTMHNGLRLNRIHDFPVQAVDCLHSYSPEVLEQNLAGYSAKSDIYSVGILTCELANGQFPFSEMPATQMLLEKLSGANPKLADSTTAGDFIVEDDDDKDQTGTPRERAENIFFQRSFSKHLHNFTARCLERDQTLRPSSEQLLNNLVFKPIKNKSSTCLPALLAPLKPLTEIAKAQRPEASADLDVARQLSEISMQDDWTF